MGVFVYSRVGPRCSLSDITAQKNMTGSEEIILPPPSLLLYLSLSTPRVEFLSHY